MQYSPTNDLFSSTILDLRMYDVYVVIIIPENCDSMWIYSCKYEMFYMYIKMSHC